MLDRMRCSMCRLTNVELCDLCIARAIRGWTAEAKAERPFGSIPTDAFSKGDVVEATEDTPVIAAGTVVRVSRVIPNTTHPGWWFYELIGEGDGRVCVVEGRRLSLVRKGSL